MASPLRPFRAEKCNPCLRNVLLPMSRNGPTTWEPISDHLLIFRYLKDAWSIRRSESEDWFQHTLPSCTQFRVERPNRLFSPTELSLPEASKYNPTYED